MKSNMVWVALSIGLFLGTSTFAGITTSFDGEDGGGHRECLDLSFAFPEPVIQSDGDYVRLDMGLGDVYYRGDGCPLIPYKVEVVTLPLNAEIEEIEVTVGDYVSMGISGKVVPAAQPMIEGIVWNCEETRWEGEVYSCDSLYPSEWFLYDIGVGRDGSNLTLFVSLHMFPVRYNPVQGIVQWVKDMDVTIHYVVRDDPVLDTADAYDLVIIAPPEFVDPLQELVAHKERHGVETRLVTTEEIYEGTYFAVQGRDDAEKVKYFIKDCLEEWGIQYVLLVGGMKGQRFSWYVPVRYTNNEAGKPSETGFLSDLYYADIYRYEEGEVIFEDWDSNGNGVFAEFTFARKDKLDGRPDVYVGRLSCRDVTDVEIMVDKIISYESGPCDPSWFKRMLLIGGDTYPNAQDPDAYEAEIDTNLSASYMTGFEIERLWTSLETLTGQTDVEEAIDRGAGFIHMAGHANPGVLVTHPPKEEETITILQVYNIPPANAIFALSLGDIKGFFEKLNDPWMPHLKNGEKLPVVVVGGCHNSQFNTTLLNIFKYGFLYAYGYGIYVPKCWSWWLTSKSEGGSIATLGNSGLGMGLEGFGYTQGLDGWLFPRFFYHYGIEGKEILGAAHSSAITDYTNTFDINGGDGTDSQMIAQWVLLGDPSLKMGGYPT